MGVIYTIIIMIVISAFLFLSKIVSLILYRIGRKVINRYILPVLSNVKKVKRQIEDEDNVVYDKTKSRQQKIKDSR